MFRKLYGVRKLLRIYADVVMEKKVDAVNQMNEIFG